MPMASANCAASSNTSGSVPSWRMSSVMLLRQIWLPKWSDMYLSGLPVASANMLGSMVEESVRMTVRSGRWPASLV